MKMIILMLQAFYFTWAITHGIEILPVQDNIWNLLILVLPNAVLVSIYGAIRS